MRSLTMIVAPAFAAALLNTPLVQADERIEGAVLGTKVTYCEAGKRATCAGRLTLRGAVEGQLQTLVIEVPVGTPISRGCESVQLHRLEGRTVIVTEDARVAKAIETVEARESAC